MFTPSPTWMSCQAAAIDIHTEHSEGEKAATERKWEKANEVAIQQRRKEKALTPSETVKTPNGEQ